MGQRRGPLQSIRGMKRQEKKKGKVSMKEWCLRECDGVRVGR